MSQPRESDRLRSAVVAAITATAPDVADDLPTTDDDVDLFEEFGLDSMDRMNIMTAVVESTGVPIPEERYSRLNTMRDIIGLLS